MKDSVSVLLAAAAVLAVCQSSQARAKTGQEDMTACTASVRAWNITAKHDIASFMGVSLERLPTLVCERLYAGVKSGRISYSDINRLQLDQSTEIWLVLKGKSKMAATPTPAPRNPNFRTCNGITGTFQIPASRKCPVSGYSQLDQPTKIDMKGRSKAAAPTRRNPKFHTCSNVYSGSFEVPASKNAPRAAASRSKTARGSDVIEAGQRRLLQRRGLQDSRAQKCPVSGYAHY